MNLFLHELQVQQLLFWRNREAAFFSFLFPIILLVLLGSVYGDDETRKERGRLQEAMTPQYKTDAAGQVHHDNLIKPDLVAPGNKVIWAAAADNRILLSNPQLNAYVSADKTRNMMTMNGTSRRRGSARRRSRTA